MKMWYVVEIIGETGIRHEPGHLTEAEALLALVDKAVELADGDETDYTVEHLDSAGPWAYSVPAQHHTP